jgi:hypothetical protein
VSVRRPELVLAAAVVLCAPTIPGVLNGNITVITAGTRLLIAIVICWCAGSMLTALTDRYSREVRRAQAIKMLNLSRRTIGHGPTTPTSMPGAEVER